MIDDEVQRLVKEQYERVQALLREHKGALQLLAEELLEYESVDGAAVQRVLGSTPNMA